MIGVKLEGVEELQKKIRSLATKEVQVSIKKGVRTAGKVLLAEARARTPKNTGKLRRYVKLRLGRKRGTRVSVRVGVMYRDGDKGAPYWGQILHRGFRIVKTGRQIPGIGKRLKDKTPGPTKVKRSKRVVLRTVGENPFIRDAFENKAESAGKMGTDEALKEILRVLGGRS